MSEELFHHKMLLLRINVLGITLREACRITTMPGHPRGIPEQAYQTSKALVDRPESMLDLMSPRASLHIGKLTEMAVRLGLAPEIKIDPSDKSRAEECIAKWKAVSVLFEPPDHRILSNYLPLLARQPGEKDRLRVRLAYLELFHSYNREEIADDIGVSVSTMNQYISSISRQTSRDIIERYCEALMIDTIPIISEGYSEAIVKEP